MKNVNAPKFHAMKELPLTLNDFKFPKTKVDIAEIQKFDSESKFMSLAVELFKEVGKIMALLACSYRLDENNNPRKWTRNEAILGGLMVRISKLGIGILDQTCQKRLEIAHILFRCFGESIINLIYLLKNKKEELFNEYIEYSLREEKRLLNKIDQNITKRGYELPIEGRMKCSIDESFKTSSFSFEQVDDTKWTPWGEKIYERAENIGMQEQYFALFSLPSHAVHGNWQELIMYHLEDENGKFSPRTDWNRPRPQYLFVSALISANANKLYLNEIMPKCPDKDEINKLLDDIIVRIHVVDEMHEKFLQK